MTRSALLFALLTFAATAPFASAAGSRQEDARNREDAEPITWGVMGQTPGCVIFAEAPKKPNHFLSSSPKNINKLTVVESLHYSLDQREYPETQQNLDSLMQRAEKDHVKYVKIPEKYTPELLQKARTACKQDQ